MDRRNIVIASALGVLGLATLTTGAVAQQKSLKEQLVGTWTLVSAENVGKDGARTNIWGPNPKGTIMYDSTGHFAQMLLRSDLPKTPSREKGSPETDRAIVKGSIAYYGNYSVDEAAKVISIRYEGSTFSGFNGTEGKRTIVSATADELKMINPATSDGTVAESTWRRAK